MFRVTCRRHFHCLGFPGNLRLWGPPTWGGQEMAKWNNQTFTDDFLPPHSKEPFPEKQKSKMGPWQNTNNTIVSIFKAFDIAKCSIGQKTSTLFLLLWSGSWIIWHSGAQSLPFQGFQGGCSTAMLSMLHFWVNTTASFRRDGIASAVGTCWLSPQLPFFLPARVIFLFGKLLLCHCATALLLVETDPQFLGCPSGVSGKESACQCRGLRRCGFNPWLRKIPWSRKWQPAPVFLPGKYYGQRSLAGYSPRDHKESPHNWTHS